MRNGRSFGAVIALVAALPGAAAASGPTYVYAKVGAVAAQAMADEHGCEDKASHAPVAATGYIPPPVGGGLAGGVAAGLANGIAMGIEKSRAERAARLRCMRSLGYVRLALTPDEARRWKAQHNDVGRQVVLTDIYAQDMSARLAAATHPVVPPFTDLEPAPFAVGGLQLDPASLAAAKAPVKAGGVLLTASAAHRRTATVRGGYHTGDQPGQGTTIDDGAVYHQIDNPFPDQDSPSLWCGMAVSHAPLGHPTLPFCVATAADGYVMRLAPFSQPWLASGPALSARTWKTRLTRPLDLVESDRDLLGPVAVELRLAQVSKDAVTVEAFALKDGKEVLFWRSRRPFGPDGRASVPLWTQRLVLSRADKLIQAELTPDGGGAGMETAAD